MNLITQVDGEVNIYEGTLDPLDMAPNKPVVVVSRMTRCTANFMDAGAAERVHVCMQHASARPLPVWGGVGVRCNMHWLTYGLGGLRAM